MEDNPKPPDPIAENLEREVKARAEQVQTLLGEIEVLLSTYAAKSEGDTWKLGFMLVLMDSLFNPETGTCEIDPWYERIIDLLGDTLRLFHQSDPTDEQLHAVLGALGYDENLIAAIVSVLGTEIGRLIDEDDEEAQSLFNVPGLD